MAPLIRAVLSNLIGEEDAKEIEIVSNEVDVHADGTWEIKYRHPTRSLSFASICRISYHILTYCAIFSGFGHDKSQAILPYRALQNPPTIFFFGDGVSGTSSFPLLFILTE